MTDEEKIIIRKQIILAFIKTPKSFKPITRLAFAIDKGLEESQKIINNRKE
jgi:hypothetical protein